MKILYLDYNLDYMNPVRQQWPIMLKHTGNVDIFGPGFVSADIVDAGLKTYIRAHGPYDFLICAESIFLRKVKHWDMDSLVKAYAKLYLIPFDIRWAFGISERITEEFLDADVNKLVTTVMLDNYNCYPELSEFLAGFNGHVIGLGQPFIKKKSDLDFLAGERFGGAVTDVWHDFIENYREKMISMPFFVMEDEFSLIELRNRKTDWAVPGAKYAARNRARQALQEAGIAWQPRHQNMIVSIWARLKLFMPLSRLEIVLLNHWFRQSIETAKFAYTCGSGYAMPIRKFFEIPALRSVLVCRPCNGFEALGFRDGENVIACEPERLADTHRQLSEDLAYAQRIADAGQALVWQHHTARARARQLCEALRAIARRDFHGSSWKNGELVLEAGN